MAAESPPEPPVSAPDTVSPPGTGLEHAPAQAGGAGAPHHLSWFITAPGNTDYLFLAMAALVIAAIITIGNLFFKLHALPERWAHNASPLQFELVAVLSLIALFTHQHIFWIAALLLALVRFPDFASPLRSITDSLVVLARGSRGDQNDDGVVRPAEPAGEHDPAPDRSGGGA